MPRPNERARKPFAQPDLSPAADEDSPPFSRFLINDEGGKALDGISEDLLSTEDKVYLLDLSLLGYQVGRQEHNISDAQARRTLFQIIEKIGPVRAAGFFAEFISDQASEQDRKLIGGLLTAASDLKDQRILGNLSAATKQAADEVAGRVGEKKEAPKVKRPRPELPVGLSWPQSDYGDWLEAQDDGGDIVTYLEREWLTILDAGRRDGRIYVDRRIIADWYPGIITAIKNYRRPDKQTGERRQIPAALRFPVEKEVNNHELGSDIMTSIKNDARLAQVVASRVRAGIKVPGL